MKILFSRFFRFADFMLAFFSGLRALKNVRDNLEKDLNCSRARSDVEEQLTNMGVETLIKIARYLEAIEEVTHRMIFDETTKLFIITTIKILTFQTQLKLMQSRECEIRNRNVRTCIRSTKTFNMWLQEMLFEV